MVIKLCRKFFNSKPIRAKLENISRLLWKPLSLSIGTVYIWVRRPNWELNSFRVFKRLKIMDLIIYIPSVVRFSPSRRSRLWVAGRDTIGGRPLVGIIVGWALRQAPRGPRWPPWMWQNPKRSSSEWSPQQSWWSCCRFRRPPTGRCGCCCYCCGLKNCSTRSEEGSPGNGTASHHLVKPLKGRRWEAENPGLRLLSPRRRQR